MYGKTKFKNSKFDESLDEELWAERTEPGILPRDNILVVQILSYNKGVPKIQFGREMPTGERLKLGRMTALEMKVILPLIGKAVQKIEEEFGQIEVKSKPIWNEEKL
jgi:hypothetical protein